MRRIVELILAAILYVLAAKLGLALATFENTSPVWPASGLGIGILYLLGLRSWPAILIGAFIANFQTGIGFFTSIAIGSGNTLEAIVGFIILQRICFSEGGLLSQKKPLGFIVSSLVSPLLSATVGVSSLRIAGIIDGTNFLQIWSTWVIGDALGILALTPIFYHEKEKIKVGPWHYKFICLMSLILISYLLFFENQKSILLFLLFPCLLLINRFCKSQILPYATIAISIVGVFATYKGFGPFSVGTLNYNLVTLQLFLAGLYLTSIALDGIKETAKFGPADASLLICWAISALISYSSEMSEQRNAELEFQARANKATSSFTRTFSIYQTSLRAGLAYLTSSKNITPNEWQKFVTNFGIVEQFPGIIGIGLIEPTLKTKDSINETKFRKLGLINFKVHDVDGEETNAIDAQDRYLIVYIEPRANNEKAIGLDIGSEKNRREAADLSRDLGIPMVTERIFLVQDAIKRPGALFLLPYYQTEKIPESIEERRKGLKGFIYAPLIYDQFFKSSLSPFLDDFEVEIFSGEKVSENSIIYRTKNHLKIRNPLMVSDTVELGGRKFTIRYIAKENFSAHSTLSAWISLIGSLLALLISSLVIGFQNIYRKAEDIAEEKTKLLSQSENKIREINQDLEEKIKERTKDLNDAYNNLKISETSFREMADSMPQIVWWSNSEGKNEFYNRHWYEVTGLNPNTEDKANTVVHPDDLEQTSKAWEESFKNETPVEAELRIWNEKEHTYRWYLSRMNPVFDENNKIKRWYGTSTDIHEQKMQEVELKRLAAVIENDPNYILLFDNDFKLIFSNQIARNSLGLGQLKLNVFSHFLRDENFIDENLLPTLQQRKTWEGELELIHQISKEFIPTYTYAFQIGFLEDGHSPTYAVVSTSLSEKKKSELEFIDLKAREKSALEATKMKSQFLANMSHEVRTPINIILGLSRMILESEISGEVREHAENLNRAGGSLLSLVNDILDFSKIEAGKLELEVREVNIPQLFEEIKSIFSLQAEQKNLQLDIQIAPTVPKTVLGDGTKIQQILSNFISNAVKFSDKGAVVIKIEAEHLQKHSYSIHFSVTDQGTGISPEAAQKLFKPFTQSDPSTSRKFGGTGLGLSICKAFVEKMDGDIGLNSELGKGSTFWFSLELTAIQKSAQVSQTQNSEIPLDRLSILLVEDNSINAQIISTMLRKRKAEVVIAENGQVAIDQLKVGFFDAVLMDCQMPIMDGYTATKMIRTSPDCEAFAKVPIIGLSANAFKEDKERCLKLGMNDYLSKPIPIEEIVKVLLEQIRGVPGTIKADQLENLYNVDNGLLLTEISELFVKSLTEGLDQLALDLKNKDFLAIKKLAHKLRSSSVNLGANYLGLLFERLEISSSRDDLEMCTKQIAQIDEEGIVTIKKLSSQLQTLLSQK